MIEVFRTNINDQNTAKHVSETLSQLLHLTNITFDLEDCDHILRIESDQNYNQKIIDLLDIIGFECEVLPD